MSCASHDFALIDPALRMVTAQFEQLERYQHRAQTDKEPHVPTCDVKELFDYQGSFERDRTGAKQRSGNLGLANRPIRRTTRRSSKAPDPGRNRMGSNPEEEKFKPREAA